MTDATAIVKTPNNRPSSPRQFFERLYGHLESNETSNINRSVGISDSIHSSENITSSEKDKNCVPELSATVCDSTYQSDDGSLSSPEILINEERLPNDCTAYDHYSSHEYDKAYYASRAAIPNIPFGFPSEPHFTAGFTAFPHFHLRGYVNKQNCRIWGTVRDKCYADNTETITTAEIQLNTSKKVLKNWSDRMGYCEANRGSLNIFHFEPKQLYFTPKK